MQDKEYLYKLAKEWEEEAVIDPRDPNSFSSVLDRIFFRGELSFKDYVQYQNEGTFPVRLKRWIDNVSSHIDKKTLIKLLPHIIFIDRNQMDSLYIDAYRRIVVPWVSAGRLNASDLLSVDYEHKIYSLLKDYRLLSITQSFYNPTFLSANNLSGLRKPTILGEDKSKISTLLPKPRKPINGLIIFEDFVGTGNQAHDVLVEVRRNTPTQQQILFVPLIILECGFTYLKNDRNLSTITIKPVLVIQNKVCLKQKATNGEPDDFRHIRPLVMSTATRVLKSYGQHDDPPEDPFGYKGSGALLVTCHNTPNNTLPLIHHRSHDWFALFRRIHHYSKDGL